MGLMWRAAVESTAVLLVVSGHGSGVKAPEANDILPILHSHKFLHLYSTFKLKSGTNINVFEKYR